jgi:hypothetical protein
MYTGVINEKTEKRLKKLYKEYESRDVSLDDIETVRSLVEAGSNFHLLSPNEQEEKLDEFESLLNNMPDYDWRKRTDVYRQIDDIWTRMDGEIDKELQKK